MAKCIYIYIAYKLNNNRHFPCVDYYHVWHNISGGNQVSQTKFGRLIVFAPFLIIKSPKQRLETYCFCSVSSYYYYSSPFFLSVDHELVHGRSQELLYRIS